MSGPRCHVWTLTRQSCTNRWEVSMKTWRYLLCSVAITVDVWKLDQTVSHTSRNEDFFDVTSTPQLFCRAPHARQGSQLTLSCSSWCNHVRNGTWSNPSHHEAASSAVHEVAELPPQDKRPTSSPRGRNVIAVEKKVFLVEARIGKEESQRATRRHPLSWRANTCTTSVRQQCQEQTFGHEVTVRFQ